MFFFDKIIRPLLFSIVRLIDFCIWVKSVILSAAVVSVEASLDSVDSDAVDVISVVVAVESAVNGKHDVVLKQKFPTIFSLKKPKRVMTASDRKSCCSQSTLMNSFCGNNEAK